MISIKTRYNHNSELLAIVEIFKTWQYYLKDCMYKVFVFMGYKTYINL